MKMTVARDSIAVIITDPVLLLGMAPTASAQVKAEFGCAGHPQILELLLLPHRFDDEALEVGDRLRFDGDTLGRNSRLLLPEQVPGKLPHKAHFLGLGLGLGLRLRRPLRCNVWFKGMTVPRLFIRFLKLPALVLAVRINGAAHDHDERYDEADDRAHVRLAAVVFVGSAADVVLAQGSKHLPFPPPVLNPLREARASWFKHFAAITMYRAHVAGGDTGRAEGDECEEVPRHGAARIEAALWARRPEFTRSYGVSTA